MVYFLLIKTKLFIIIRRHNFYLFGESGFCVKYKKAIIIFLLLAGLTVLFLTAFSDRLLIRRYTVRSDKLCTDIRIALIADLHGSKYGDGQKDLIAAINRENPDILLLGGDLFDDEVPNNLTYVLLSYIGKRYPCFFVTGNHEYWSGEVSAFKSFVRDAGITLLEGANETVTVRGQKIIISGIDDPAGGKKRSLRQLDSAGSALDSSLFNILLAHRPEFIDTYLKYPFDLILSGHTHGGQWRIPFLLNGVLAPNQGWFPKYAGGLYRLGNVNFIISRGLSTNSTRIPRIFNRPELVIINLQPE